MESESPGNGRVWTHPRVPRFASQASHTQLSLETMFLASLLLGIVVTGGGDPGASTHHAPGARMYAVACAHTSKAEGAHSEGGCGKPR